MGLRLTALYQICTRSVIRMRRNTIKAGLVRFETYRLSNLYHELTIRYDWFSSTTACWGIFGTSMIEIQTYLHALPIRQNAAADKVEPLSESVYRQEKPDQHFEARDRQGALQARCSIWHEARARPSSIGHYAAATDQAGQNVLEYACQALCRRGACKVVGPMDGTTWRKYRWVTQAGDRPPFFMEPSHPERYPLDWIAVGFKPSAQYFSAWCDDLSHVDPRLDRVRTRLAEAGVIIRSFSIANFTHELAGIHALSLATFADNYLYSPIDLDAFIAMYQPIRDRIVPDLIQLAEHEGRLVGYVFAIPDFAQAMRGQTVDTVIVKTVAVRSGRTYAGMGNLLVEQVHHLAQRMGMIHAIHALMHESNISVRLSGHYAKPFRRYTLFERELKG